MAALFEVLLTTLVTAATSVAVNRKIRMLSILKIDDILIASLRKFSIHSINLCQLFLDKCRSRVGYMNHKDSAINKISNYYKHLPELQSDFVNEILMVEYTRCFLVPSNLKQVILPSSRIIIIFLSGLD